MICLRRLPLPFQNINLTLEKKKTIFDRYCRIMVNKKTNQNLLQLKCQDRERKHIIRNTIFKNIKKANEVSNYWKLLIHCNQPEWVVTRSSNAIEKNW